MEQDLLSSCSTECRKYSSDSGYSLVRLESELSLLLPKCHPRDSNMQCDAAWQGLRRSSGILSPETLHLRFIFSVHLTVCRRYGKHPKHLDAAQCPLCFTFVFV